MQFSTSSFPRLNLGLSERDRRRFGQVLTPVMVGALTILAYRFWA